MNSPKHQKISEIKALEKSLATLSKYPFGKKLRTTPDSNTNDLKKLINNIIVSGEKEVDKLKNELEKANEKLYENKKIKNQFKESLNELLKLQKLSETVSISHNIDDVLNSSEKLCRGIVPVKEIGVFLFDKQGKDLIPLRVVNLSSEVRKNLQDQLEDGIIEWVIRERRPTMIPDIRDISQNTKNRKEKNFIIIPLVVRNQNIGVYYICTHISKNSFTQQQTELLSMLSNVVAIAIENSQLYEQMNLTIKELVILYEIGRQLVSALKPQKIYKALIETLCSKLSLKSGWIFEVEQSKRLVTKAFLGQHIPAEMLLKKTPFHEVFKKRDAVLLNEYSLRRYKNFFNNTVFKSAVFAPFFHRGNISGIICIASHIDEPLLEQHHLRLLKTIATQTGIAVENSRLYLDLVQANKDLTEMQGQLIRSGKLAALGQLAGGVAHEVNNPLQIILGRVQIVQMKIKDDSIKQEIKIVESETKRIASIVRGLLTFARRGEKNISFESVDINKILKEALVLVRHQMNMKEINLEENYSPSLPAVMADADMMKQVFLNIYINAEQAMDSKGIFKIKTRYDKKFVYISFTDTGKGITKDDIEKIFEPFFTTKENIEGSGLGLSVTKEIIEKHKGQISVKSKLNKGSTFQIILPVCE